MLTIVRLNSIEPNGTISYTLDGSVPPNGLSCEAPVDGKPSVYDYYEGSFALYRF